MEIVKRSGTAQKKAGKIGAGFLFGEGGCGTWKSNSTVKATEAIF
jgi:hypothetical protein